MLTYAFDLLYAIYEEEGYNPPDIPRLILEKNLYGMEIDERAGALAAFALTMKAREQGPPLLRARRAAQHLRSARRWQFDRGANWQQARPGCASWARKLLDLPRAGCAAARPALLAAGGQLWLAAAPAVDARRRLPACAERIGARPTTCSATTLQRRRGCCDALAQVAYLARSYHVVVANPPYMGSRQSNEELKKFARDNYPDSKSDLFRHVHRAQPGLADATDGLVGMITMQSWMFLSSYEKLRGKLLSEQTILIMAHLGCTCLRYHRRRVLSSPRLYYATRCLPVQR